jgi:hypothetical protein
MNMAKENTAPTGSVFSAASVSTAAAPVFALYRTVLDEIDREAERWLDYSLAQQREAAEVARTIRNQTVGITRTVLGTVEQTASGMLDAAQSFTKPFFKVGA